MLVGVGVNELVLMIEGTTVGVPVVVVPNTVLVDGSNIVVVDLKSQSTRYTNSRARAYLQMTALKEEKWLAS